MGFPARKRAKLKIRARHSPFARRVMLPAGEFIRVKEIAGLPLIVAAMLALAWANSPWSNSYLEFWHAQQEIRLFWFSYTTSLRHWINDALLPLFFFVAGLEIKRELIRGELSTLKTASFPFFLALGGVLVPAAIYLALNTGDAGAPRGWGVPVATDVAFALGILALLGDRVPYQLKVLVLTFAAVDDVFGVLVIALVYSGHLAPYAALAAAVIFALIVVLRVFRVPLISLFVVLGLALWFAFLKAGVHPTVMGVMLGLLAPATPQLGRDEFDRITRNADDRFHELHQERVELADREDLSEEEEDRLSELCAEEDALVGLVEEQARQTEAVTDRLIHNLNPWVSYLILPLFALSNAGVSIDLGQLQSLVVEPAALGVIAGLVVGKPIGLLLFAGIAVLCRLAELPPSLRWSHLVGASLLAGIGFTVSLFIADLAFSDDEQLLDAVKLAIMAASVAAAVFGLAVLRFWRSPG